MKMEYRLACPRPIVDNNPVSALMKTLSLCHITRNHEQFAKQRHLGIRCVMES